MVDGSDTPFQASQSSPPLKKSHDHSLSTVSLGPNSGLYFFNLKPRGSQNDSLDDRLKVLQELWEGVSLAPFELTFIPTGRLQSEAFFKGKNVFWGNEAQIYYIRTWIT